MEPVLTVTQQGQRRFVPGEPVQSTAIVARPVDVQQLATDAMSANNAMVLQVLRSMGTTIDAERTPAQPGLSSPAELAARNTRFKWVIVAVVVLAAITAAGIVSVAYLAGHVSGAGAIAGWLVLSGVAGYASVTYVHHKEANLSPEALEGERIAGDYDVSATDAESRQILARAYADAVRDDAAARRASAEAQRAANLAYTQAPAQRQMDYTPRERPESPAVDDCSAAPPETPVRPAGTPTAPAAAPAAPDPVLASVLDFLDRQHANYVATGRTLIQDRLPWSARGAMPQGDKERVEATLAHIVNPPIVAGAGNRLHWNPHQPWQRTRRLIAEHWR